MLKSTRHIFIIIFLIISTFSNAITQTTGEEILQLETPQRLVNDFAKVLSPDEVFALEQKLVLLDDSSSNQVAIVTLNSLSGYEPSDLAYRIAEKWGIGHQEDNGVLILMKPKLSANDRGYVYITVGYGLEDVIPDAIAKRIVENEIIPYFKLGDTYGGLNAATTVIADLATQKYSSNEYIKKSAGSSRPLIFIIIALIILYSLSRNRSNKSDDYFDGDGPVSYRGGRTPWIFFPRGGSSFGGGSSYNGGGFGGFGGGSFGGGGAGGSW